MVKTKVEVLEHIIHPNNKIIYAYKLAIGGQEKVFSSDEYIRLVEDEEVEILDKAVKVYKILEDSSYLGNKYRKDNIPIINLTGEELRVNVEGELHGIKGSRDIYEELYSKVVDKTDSKVILLHGLRRTGKTVMLNQLVEDIVKGGIATYEQINLITIYESTISRRDVYELLESITSANNVKYVIIDEFTMVNGLVDSSQYIHDRFCTHGVKFIITGTNSFAIRLLNERSLATRSKLTNVPPLTMKEYSTLVGPINAMEYIKVGGIFSDAFKFEKDTKSYLHTAIAKNISESLVNGSRDYCKLTGDDFSSRKITIEAVVNRVLYNSMKELGVKSINELFKTNYSAGVRLGRDFEIKLIERLEHDLKVNSEEIVSEDLYKGIKDVLIKMDIIRQVYNDYSEPGVRARVAYSLTRYPGLVYAFYNIISGREFITSELKVTDKEARDMDRKYREVLEGHILEGLIISDIITTSNGETRTFNINNTEEIDIIHRNENGVISLIEVKRRKTYEPIQMRWLINKKIGEIYNSNKCVNRMVVYNGKTKVISIDPIKIGRLRKLSEDIDISIDYVYYINVDEFLLDLENYLSGNKINQMREEYENPVHNEFINIDTKGIGDGDEYSQHEDTSLLF